MLRDKCSGRGNIELMQGYGGIQAGSLQALDLLNKTALDGGCLCVLPMGQEQQSLIPFLASQTRLTWIHAADSGCHYVNRDCSFVCFPATQNQIITQWDHWPD